MKHKLLHCNWRHLYLLNIKWSVNVTSEEQLIKAAQTCQVKTGYRSPLWLTSRLFCIYISGDIISILSISDPVLQSEDPFVVRLLFEPSGRPDSQQDYYLTAKENLCVVCGKADSYIRFDMFTYILIYLNSSEIEGVFFLFCPASIDYQNQLVAQGGGGVGYFQNLAYSCWFLQRHQP